jgi:hypothetical protein
MQLILSCIHDVNSVTNKDHLFLLVDTGTSHVEWLSLNIKETNDIIGSKSLCMSGDFLIAALSTTKELDSFVIVDVVKKKHTLTDCRKSKNIHGIASVFMGRVYCISTETDSMNNIVFSLSSNKIVRDVNHYSFDEAGIDNYHINSLVNWNRRWYVSYFGKGWKNGDFTNGAIIELSKNNRAVYSNINQPNSLFFNRRDEMCFCESGKGLFHHGKKITYIGGYLRGAIEDPYNNGYWIGISAERKDIPSTPARLIFISYQGIINDEIVLPQTYDIYDIVEAEGYISTLL